MIPLTQNKTNQSTYPMIIEECYHNGWVYFLGEKTTKTERRKIMRRPYLDPNGDPEYVGDKASAHCLWVSANRNGEYGLYCLGGGKYGPQVWEYKPQNSPGNPWGTGQDSRDQQLSTYVQLLCLIL